MHHLTFQIEKEYTFLDYIMGGCQINFTVSLEMSNTTFNTPVYVLKSTT